jgi:hypothetical protein
VICRLLDLTTAHLPLRERENMPTGKPTFEWGCAIVPTDHGWFVSVPNRCDDESDDDGDHAARERLMPILSGIIEHARACDALWINLDADAEHEHGLPQYSDDDIETDCTHPACKSVFVRHPHRPQPLIPHRSRQEIKTMPDVITGTVHTPHLAADPDKLTLDREQVGAMLAQLKLANMHTIEAFAPIIEHGTRVKTEIQALADRLFQLRGDYQPGGDTKPETNSATLSAAFLESFASYLACLADDVEIGKRPLMGLDTPERALVENLRTDLGRWSR